MSRQKGLWAAHKQNNFHLLLLLFADRSCCHPPRALLHGSVQTIEPSIGVSRPTVDEGQPRVLDSGV